MIKLTDILNEDENPCWKGYKQIGMKKKDGKEVPNCVPESVSENFTPEQSYNGLFKFKHKGKTYVGQVVRKDGGKYVLSLHDIGLLSIPGVSPNDMEYLGNVSDQGKGGLPYLSAHPKNFQKVQNGQFYKELVFKGGLKFSLPTYLSDSGLKDINKYYRLKLTKDDLKVESVNEGKFKPSQVRSAISRVKKQLMRKWKQKGGYENFGQKELSQMKDKFDYNAYGDKDEREISHMLDAFDNWAMNYDGNMREARRSVVHKAVKKGSFPVALVVVKNGKVVDQELVKTPEAVPAAFNVIQSKHKGAVVHIEDKTGKRLFSESLNEISAIGGLKQVVKGNTKEVEGIKVSKEMAQAMIDWFNSSPYGRKYPKAKNARLHVSIGVMLAFGLDRYAKHKGAKEELKYLKSLKESIIEGKDPEIITQLRDVLKSGYKTLKDPKSGKRMKVDTYSASAIVGVYDKLNPSNQEKFVKQGLLGMQSLAFKFIK